MKKVAECLYLNESSGTYFALVKRGGKQIRRSLKTQDRKLAERRLKKFRDEASKLSKNADERKLAFEDLAKRWLKVSNAHLKPSSALRNVRCVERLEDTFKGKTVAQVSRLDCENWMATRSRAISGRTFNYELQVLKRIFKYGMDSGILISNPAESLDPKKERKKAIVIPSRDQFETLVSTLREMAKTDARNRHAVVLVQMLALSGMRLGEAVRMEWREADFERDEFTVSGGEEGTKNGESRIVPLFPQFRDFLEALLTNHKSERKDANTAISELPNPHSRIVKIDSAKKALASACRKAGLPNFGHHCLRHYFVSNAIERRIDFKTIAAWVGHKDGGLLVAKTYGHLRDTHSREMAKLMA